LDDLAQQLEEFRSHLADERRASPLTVSTYMRDLLALHAYCVEHDLPLDARQLRTGTLRAFLAASFDGRTASTMARKVSAVRAFFRFLEKRGRLTDNPAASLTRPKVQKPLPEFVTVEDAFRVVAAPGKHAPDVVDDQRAEAIALRDAAILELLYSSGARVSEVAGLSLGSLDLAGHHARVLGKGQKERLVPLGAECIAALTAYLPRRRTWWTRTASSTARRSSWGASAHASGRVRCRTWCSATACWARGARTSTRTPCVTPAPPTCWTLGQTCAASRSCWGTPASAPPSATPT
jgi:integrase/recombinase XerC